MLRILARHASGGIKPKIFCEGMDQQFYVRNNLFAKRQTPTRPLFAYNLHSINPAVSKAQATASLYCMNCVKDTQLKMNMHFYQSGAMRMLVESPAENRLKASQYVLAEDELVPASGLTMEENKNAAEFTITHKANLGGQEGVCRYVVHTNPFWIECYFDDHLAMTINRRQLFNYELYRQVEPMMAGIKDAADLATALSLLEQSALERTMACPKGPASVGLDFSFHGLPDCYGLPERLLSGPLEDTNGTIPSPYRLYNVDHFDESYTRQSVYGNIPLIIANNPEKPYNAGILWLNASDTYVDLHKSTDAHAHFISECGALEFMAFLGKTPLDITSNYAKVTGKTPLPQRFTLGYHHSRWDNDTQKDVLSVSDKFHEHKIPCDCLWLDIEHTDGKKYFTWDPKAFPTPDEMLKELHSRGRSMVLISDPHIKIDSQYNIYSKAIKDSIVEGL